MKLILIVTLLAFTATVSADDCSKMSKQFFLDEMDGIVGENAPRVKDRPKYVAKLLREISSRYPNVDATKCMAEGLVAAKLLKTSMMKSSKYSA